MSWRTTPGISTSSMRPIGVTSEDRKLAKAQDLGRLAVRSSAVSSPCCSLQLSLVGDGARARNVTGDGDADRQRRDRGSI